jgi:hypothetical protein
MKLPKREFYTVHEVATRWGYTIADVAGWSAASHFDILTGTHGRTGTRWANAGLDAGGSAALRASGG